ncbi:MAG: YaaR family protein [Lachnospiraceae bacterium]|nr:YaaR family protein [Lachnospiraceae bacterium]MDE6232852.1 YaaR family protein [Lachnospiraceae bacterium]MDE6251528.1 YaaR family protein [Lachnospiraceae bacterium]
MDMRVNEAVQVTQSETQKQVAQQNDNFKFMLASNIEEKDLQAKISTMIGEISDFGKRISKKTDIRDMKYYRGLIKEFLNEIVYRSHSFSRENYLDRKGRHRVYGIIRLIDKNLDELAQELIKDEKDNIKILNLVGDIEGMLLDILT